MFIFSIVRRGNFLLVALALGNAFFALKSMDGGFAEDLSGFSDQELAERWQEIRHKILNDVLDSSGKELCKRAFDDADLQLYQECETAIGSACNALAQKASEYWTGERDVYEFIKRQPKDLQELPVEDQAKLVVALNLKACIQKDDWFSEFSVRNAISYLMKRNSEEFLKNLSRVELSQRVSHAVNYLINSLFDIPTKKAYEAELQISSERGNAFFTKKAQKVCGNFYEKSVFPIFSDLVAIQSFYERVVRKKYSGQDLSAEESRVLQILDTSSMCQAAVVGLPILEESLQAKKSAAFWRWRGRRYG